jgi:hypothetical protein
MGEREGVGEREGTGEGGRNDPNVDAHMNERNFKKKETQLETESIFSIAQFFKRGLSNEKVVEQ